MLNDMEIFEPNKTFLETLPCVPSIGNFLVESDMEIRLKKLTKTIEKIRMNSFYGGSLNGINQNYYKDIVGYYK